MLKLRTEAVQRDALLRTMEAYTFAFNASASWGFKNGTHNRIRNHRGTYFFIRAEIPNLNSGLVQAARDCACAALKRDKLKKLPNRRINAAIRYNKNSSRIVLNHGFVSLSTIIGRIKLHFYCSKYLDKFKDWRVVNSVLVYDKKVKDFFFRSNSREANPT